MKFTKDNATSLLIDIPSDSQQDFSITLMSDVHFDSAICDLALFYEHMKDAERHQTPVFINGDSLDAMQGKYDPRRTPEDLKKTYNVSAYYDALVIDYANYLSQFDVPGFILGDGNHETSVLDHSGTDLLENVCYRLRVEYGKEAIHMGYWGYIEYRFNYKRGNASNKILQYFHHGDGGSAPVTKSTIQINRQAAWLVHPDIVHNGHTHDAYCVPQPVEKYNDKTHKPYADNMWFIRTPGYKKSPTVSHRTRGFESEHHRAPKPRGCYILNLHYNHSAGDTIKSEILQKIS